MPSRFPSGDAALQVAEPCGALGRRDGDGAEHAGELAEPAIERRPGTGRPRASRPPSGPPARPARRASPRSRRAGPPCPPGASSGPAGRRPARRPAARGPSVASRARGRDGSRSPFRARGRPLPGSLRSLVITPRGAAVRWRPGRAGRWPAPRGESAAAVRSAAGARVRAATRPISSSGCRTVGGGDSHSQVGRSSKPTTLRSSGMRRRAGPPGRPPWLLVAALEDRGRRPGQLQLGHARGCGRNRLVVEVAGPDEVLVDLDPGPLQRGPVAVHPRLPVAEHVGGAADHPDAAVAQRSGCSVAARPPAQLVAPTLAISASGRFTGSTRTSPTADAPALARGAASSGRHQDDPVAVVQRGQVRPARRTASSSRTSKTTTPVPCSAHSASTPRRISTARAGEAGQDQVDQADLRARRVPPGRGSCGVRSSASRARASRRRRCVR